MGGIQKKIIIIKLHVVENTVLNSSLRFTSGREKINPPPTPSFQRGSEPPAASGSPGWRERGSPAAPEKPARWWRCRPLPSGAKMTRGTGGEKQLPITPSSQSRLGHLQARQNGGLVDMQIGETRNKGGAPPPPRGRGRMRRWEPNPSLSGRHRPPCLDVK